MTTFSHVGSGALRRQSLTDMPIKSSATGPFLCRLPHRRALLLPGQITPMASPTPHYQRTAIELVKRKGRV